MGFEPERKVAVEAVRRAAGTCEEMRRNGAFSRAVEKTDGSPVTLADFFVQAAVNGDLASAFPDIPVAAEESSLCLEEGDGRELLGSLGGLLPGKSTDEILRIIDRGSHGGGRGRFWTLDPVDGTKGFVANRQYAVALALIEDGEAVVGVLGCPRLGGAGGFLFFAEKGLGAYQTSLAGGPATRISVSDVRRACDAVMCESAEPSHSSRGHSEKIAGILGMGASPVRIDSQCKYAVLARGEASVYFRLPVKKDYEENIWDHAAGCAVVGEAGGKVTDCAGKPLDFSLGKTLRANRGVVGTNGVIHREVLETVKKVLSGENPSRAASPETGRGG